MSQAQAHGTQYKLGCVIEHPPDFSNGHRYTEYHYGRLCTEDGLQVAAKAMRYSLATLSIPRPRCQIAAWRVYAQYANGLWAVDIGLSRKLTDFMAEDCVAYNPVVVER